MGTRQYHFTYTYTTQGYIHLLTMLETAGLCKGDGREKARTGVDSSWRTDRLRLVVCGVCHPGLWLRTAARGFGGASRALGSCRGRSHAEDEDVHNCCPGRTTGGSRRALTRSQYQRVMIESTGRTPCIYPHTTYSVRHYSFHASQSLCASISS